MTAPILKPADPEELAIRLLNAETEIMVMRRELTRLERRVRSQEDLEDWRTTKNQPKPEHYQPEVF